MFRFPVRLSGSLFYPLLIWLVLASSAAADSCSTEGDDSSACDTEIKLAGWAICIIVLIPIICCLFTVAALLGSRCCGCCVRGIGWKQRCATFFRLAPQVACFVFVAVVKAMCCCKMPSTSELEMGTTARPVAAAQRPQIKVQQRAIKASAQPRSGANPSRYYCGVCNKFCQFQGQGGLPQCCSCRDVRPFDPTTLMVTERVYVNGMGHVTQEVPRNTQYCLSCRDAQPAITVASEQSAMVSAQPQYAPQAVPYEPPPPPYTAAPPPYEAMLEQQPYVYQAQPFVYQQWQQSAQQLPPSFVSYPSPMQNQPGQPLTECADHQQQEQKQQLSPREGTWASVEKTPM